MATLIITADDYGYRRSYDEGIVEAAAAAAIDAVSAFATRGALGAGPLIETGVEIGLHLDLGADATAPRARPADRAAAARALRDQFAAFTQAYGREPAYIDGHHHGHARDGLGVVVSDFAVEAGLPVRSINPRHRRLLRCRGAATNDLLIGRLSEDQPVLPPELGSWGEQDLVTDAVVEWMVHPGRPDPSSESSYDAGRGEDLRLLLGWAPPQGLSRGTHRSSLSPAAAC